MEGDRRLSLSLSVIDPRWRASERAKDRGEDARMNARMKLRGKKQSGEEEGLAVFSETESGLTDEADGAELNWRGSRGGRETKIALVENKRSVTLVVNRRRRRPRPVGRGPTTAS